MRRTELNFSVTVSSFGLKVEHFNDLRSLKTVVLAGANCALTAESGTVERSIEQVISSRKNIDFTEIENFYLNS